MKLPKLFAVVIIGVVILVGIIVMLGMRGNKSSLVTPNQQPSIEVTTVPTNSPYSDWTYFKNGYGIKIPSDWKNTSDINGTAVLEPGSKLGSIAKISITHLSDKKAPQGQRFTTQKEFDQWYAVKGDLQGKIQKIKNTSLDGEKAMMLMDSSGGDTKWLAIIWTRKDNVNLYITVNGTGKYSMEDENAVNALVTSFVFQAPLSDGKEEK